MPVRANELMDLVRQVTDRDPRQRELGADRVPDWLDSYSSTDAKLLVGALSISAACESDLAALESQLNALLELGAGGFTDAESVGHLRGIDLSTLPTGLSDYVNDLLETA